MKIYKAELVDCDNTNNEIGKLFVNGEDLLFATKNCEKCLKLVEFQIEGKNTTNTKEFLGGIGRNIQ